MSKSRKLFEEVGAESAKDRPRETGLIDKGRRGARGAIRIWLMMLFGLVALMILIGGLTRLTDSGLSITEWAPVAGALPPMDAATWDQKFEKYKQIPEYRLQNVGMTLQEFKFIYWWEWGHRQLGRVVGLVWAVGFLGFLATRSIPPGWTGRLFLLGVLGGAQGAIGWWMVSSGLSGDRIDVASYRLATHLGLAFVILGVISWQVFQLGQPERELLQRRRNREGKLFSMGTGLMHFAFLQILLGALVAGIDAGRNYTDWPLMAGGIFPPTPFEIEPIWRNFFENAGTVQFMHRVAGYLLFIFGVVAWLRARRSPNADTRFRFNAVMAMMTLQMVLGVVTVLYGAPLEIAIVHQLGAVALWVLIIRARFGAGYPKPQSLRGQA
ncbi:COX15/CtaA family protein [Roseivivax sp. GX 12232]|uniref:heme A synthase n=1 Tax=Roseivivax sp. GX 12232 TaxID=2900547 RepID=UPI001E36F2F6|nr:heme A synthase [Roseivivax sp. GX 12232]MCE0503825.1 COX15/CtaA family protein [Roseivivax sp. GX 12232]